MTNDSFLTVQDEFSALAGAFAGLAGENRSLGRIYGFLYIGKEPASLGEIATRLGMSKGNASLNLRRLEMLGAVRRVSAVGDRQDRYEARRDLGALARGWWREGMLRRLENAERGLSRLRECAGAEAGGLAALEDLVRGARRLAAADTGAA